jgi:hypothetical protein
MMQLAAWAKANWLLLIVLGLFVGAFIFLRHRPSNVASLDELDDLLGAGQPTVVEFYSNF